MPPSRNTAEPSFGDWVIETALLPTAPSGGWPPGFQIVREHPTVVPHYQRGISWEVPQVNELVYSTSPVIGSVVLGKFGAQPNPYLDPQLAGAATSEYEELADGLQRFSTGVVLLTAIFEKVLDNGSPHAALAPAFAQVNARYGGMRGQVKHNDHQLRNHPRRAISDQYTAFADTITRWVEDQLVPANQGQFAQAITQLLLVRPIAIDRWSGFGNALALMDTFLGLNTVRVELGPVDLLRARLVIEASRSNWTDTDIETFENDLTDAFTTNGKNDSELLPFVNAILKLLGGPNAAPTSVFPTWGNLNRTTDVDPFLDFVNAMKGAANPYLDQIRRVGAIPFGIILAVHLRRYRATVQPNGQAQLPGFATGAATPAEEAELHQMLCGSIRSALIRRLGYESQQIVEALSGNVGNLADAADILSMDAVTRPVNALVDEGWLRGQLDTVDKAGARMVFNALLLPARADGVTPSGGPYQPLVFGRGAHQWAVDHIHPESMLDKNRPGFSEGRHLRNLAPLPGAQNSAAKHVAASIKLKASLGSYYGPAINPHSYAAYLAGGAGNQDDAVLNNQEELVPNSASGLGDARLDHLVAELYTRI